jgi:hypothetical protein
MLDSDYQIYKKNIEIKNFISAIESQIAQMKSESIDYSHASRAICTLATDMLQTSVELYQIKMYESALACHRLAAEKISG